MENSKVVETWLPLFSGFYGSMWEADETSEIEYVQNERARIGLSELDPDEIEMDYEEYNRDVSESCTNTVDNWLTQMEMVVAIRFQKLSSPKYYNFENDSIHVEVELSDDNRKRIMRYVTEYSEDFKDYVSEHYTSYDGFHSHHSNDYLDWLMDSKVLEHAHKLGAILQFILTHEPAPDDREFRHDTYSEYDLYDDAIVDCYLSVKNHGEITSMEYCTECQSFVDRKDCTIPGTCTECFDLNRHSGDLVVCASCYTHIDNRWQARNLGHQIKHGFLKVTEVHCDKCQ